MRHYHCQMVTLPHMINTYPYLVTIYIDIFLLNIKDVGVRSHTPRPSTMKLAFFAQKIDFVLVEKCQ